MRTYTVPKGKTYSVGLVEKATSIFSMLGKTEVAFRFILHSSCFDSGLEVDHINKVYGITWGLGDDHENSIRIGWDTKGQLYAYFYINGEGPQNIPLITALPGVEYSAFISNYRCTVTGGGKTFTATLPVPCITSWFAFPCYFYAEGNAVLMHSVSCSVERVK